MAENTHFSSVKVLGVAAELAAKLKPTNQIADKMEEIIAKANSAWEGGIASDMLGKLRESPQFAASVAKKIDSYSAILQQADENYEKAEIHNTNLMEDTMNNYT